MRQLSTLDWRSLPPEAKQQLYEELIKRQGSRVSTQFKRKYRGDPVAFVRDCFNWREGEKPAAYQDEILAELPVKKRVSVRSPHGAGKTTLAAWIILWFALTRDGEDWKIPTTASSWRQLTKFLWPEIHKWVRCLRWDRVGRQMFDKRTELLTLSLKLFSGEAFACASDDPTMIEGAHADQLLYVFDEAKAIKGDTFDAAEGAFSGGGSAEAFALAISTPGEPAGRFYDIHTRKPGYEDWTVKHVTLADAIASGRISASWAEQRKRQWGEKSAVYQNRVAGEFCATDDDGVIPLAWIELANERWEVWDESKEWFPFTAVGVDVSRSQNGDKTCLALRHEKTITELRRSTEVDVMVVTGKVASILRARGGLAVVDVIGIGAGVVDRLREQSFSVVAFNAGEGSTAKDRSGELEFLNTRAAAWWNLRELLDPANNEDIALPPDDELTGDLTAPHWKMTSAGKIQIESKDELRKRLGRSTDDGDAVVMAYYKKRKRQLLYA
jgi:hypothetical protein